MTGEAPIALVVEDDPIIRMDAVEILQAAGFRTLDCGSADHAIPLLVAHEGQITLVFTDVEMPGSMNGFALARHIDATWPEIGVLVASGRVHPAPGELPEAALFIRNPFSAEVVHTRVKDVTVRIDTIKFHYTISTMVDVEGKSLPRGADLRLYRSQPLNNRRVNIIDVYVQLILGSTLRELTARPILSPWRDVSAPSSMTRRAFHA